MVFFDELPFSGAKHYSNYKMFDTLTILDRKEYLKTSNSSEMHFK
jgi:hypothetical protein